MSKMKAVIQHETKCSFPQFLRRAMCNTNYSKTNPFGKVFLQISVASGTYNANFMKTANAYCDKHSAGMFAKSTSPF